MLELTRSPMVFGELPCISVEHVRDALEALIHDSTETQEDNPVFFLLLVDEQLSNPDLPKSPLMRVFIAHQLLINLITEEYTKLRKLFGLQLPSEDETREAALRAVAVDASKTSMELLGWSQAYYRFVRVNLAFDLKEIGDVSAVHERTLRRYHTRIVSHLTKKLIELEQQARTRQRKRRLIAALPQVTPTWLVGRNDVLVKTQQILNNPGQHIYVTGSAGIGKTTFVQEIVRQQIDSGQIKQLYWMRRPNSAQFVRESIIQENFPEGLRISLREYLLMHSAAIVLDDAESLFYDLAALDDLLEYFSPAFVYIISRTYHPLSRVALHIHLQPLTRFQTEELARQLATSEFDNFDELWERTSGNPFAVRMLMRNPAFLEANDDGAMQRLLMMGYNTLAPDEKRTCLMLTLCPPGNIEVSQLEHLWHRDFDEEHINTLADRQLIDMVSFDSVSLPTSVRIFLENSVVRSPEDKVHLRTLIDRLEDVLEHYTADALPIVEHILMAGWLKVDEDRRTRWAENFAAEAIRQGHWAIWRSILETIASPSPMLHILYGVCLRRLAEWELAEAVFSEAIAEAGYKGMFVEQARAALELAVLLRYKGEYEKALDVIDSALRTGSRYRERGLVYMAQLEKAQIAVDAGNGNLAQQLLLTLPTTMRVLSLRSEAALLQNDLDTSVAYATSALPLAADEKSTVGRLYTLLGRIYHAKREPNLARRYLALAVTLLEQVQDIFALARAESNLAALMIHSHSFREAEQLLLRAETIQKLLGDQVALRNTQHNLQIVRLKLASETFPSKKDHKRGG